MIKLQHLLLENPDTVWYNQNSYSYMTKHNRSAFLVYDDLINKHESYFGYDHTTKKFYSNDDGLVDKVEKLSNAPANNRITQVIKSLRDGNNGGSHYDVWLILELMNRGRGNQPLNRGRFFEVPDNTKPGGKVCIMTFWYVEEKADKYKDTWDKMCKDLRLNPKEILYNPGSRVMTYDEFYKTGKQDKPVDKHTSTYDPDTFKVGDKIRLKGFPDTNGVITHIGGDNTHIDGNHNTIEITKSTYPFGAFRLGRSIKLRSSDIELDTTNASDNTPVWIHPDDSSGPGGTFGPDDTVAGSAKLDKVIKDKEEEHTKLSGELHSKKAVGKNNKPRTPEETAALEKEVNGLAFEIAILSDLLNSGEKYYTHNVKDVVATSVQRKLHALEKEKKNRYSLIAQAEKQYGMPIAQIRSKYRNVPLDQLVKKESLYKKLLKALF